MQNPLPTTHSRFLSSKKEMSRRNGLKLDFKLNINLSPPSRINLQQVAASPTRSATDSPLSSCISSEMSQDEDQTHQQLLTYSSSPEATTMVLVGCSRCLMYFMLSEDEPKCPKCKSTVLLEFLHGNAATSDKNSTSSRKTRHHNNL